MAEEDVDLEQSEEGNGNSGGTSVVRMIGLGLGFFILMVASQIVTPLILQQFAPWPAARVHPWQRMRRQRPRRKRTRRGRPSICPWIPRWW